MNKENISTSAFTIFLVFDVQWTLLFDNHKITTIHQMHFLLRVQHVCQFWNQNNSQSLVLLTKVAKIDEVVEGVEGVKGETKTTLDASR